MCGIVGYLSKEVKPVVSIYRGLKKLEYRGYDSWGIVYLIGGKLVSRKGLGKLSDEPKNLPKSVLAMGHTRWATHGGITIANSHPHFDCHKKVAVVHNGIVENYLVLKKELQARKHRFESETDTEVVAHLIEEKTNKGLKLEEAVRQIFLRLKGFNALVVMDRNQKTMVAIKTGSSLILGLSNTTSWVASDINALGEAEELIILLDGEMAVINEGGVVVKNVIDGENIDKERIKMVEIDKESSKGRYKSFLEKEINEQPKVLEQIMQGGGEQMEKIIEIIKGMEKVIVVACGSSYLAGMIVAEKIMKKIGKWTVAVLASEFDTWVGIIDEKTLVIALTQSGETIDVVDALNKAKQKGAVTASIVNSRYSSVKRLTDECQLLSCGVEKSVVATKSFVAQMAVVDKAIGVDLTERIKDVKRILKNKVLAENIAKRLYKENNIFILGKGKMYPIALEGALKIKEVSYIHAEGIAGGELKHGTLALVEKGTICIVLVSKENRSEILANTMEVKARGAIVIGFAKREENVFDYYLPISSNEESEQTEAVVWLQLLASKLCELKHLDPDKPRNLAKSVTVK